MKTGLRLLTTALVAFLANACLLFLATRSELLGQIYSIPSVLAHHLRVTFDDRLNSILFSMASNWLLLWLAFLFLDRIIR